MMFFFSRNNIVFKMLFYFMEKKDLFKYKAQV